MNLKLRYYGDPALRVVSRPVTDFGEPVRRIAQEMLVVMREKEGVGLAAQQVGETLALCVIDISSRVDTDEEGRRYNPDLSMPMIIANPRIVHAGEALECYEEGCLSFPEITAPIERPGEIDLEYQDETGAKRTVHLKGLAARAVQHEMDHLAGILIVDRMSQIKRLALSGRLKRLSRETKETLTN
ncbi:MAG: peptide deformylase [Kiritimatiellia bacterium]|nr:peptide deformylase [Kiritimatiellia bacterium]